MPPMSSRVTERRYRAVYPSLRVRGGGRTSVPTSPIFRLRCGIINTHCPPCMDVRCFAQPRNKLPGRSVVGPHFPWHSSSYRGHACTILRSWRPLNLLRSSTIPHKRDEIFACLYSVTPTRRHELARPPGMSHRHRSDVPPILYDSAGSVRYWQNDDSSYQPPSVLTYVKVLNPKLYNTFKTLRVYVSYT
jgi:hypothetical protein